MLGICSGREREGVRGEGGGKGRIKEAEGREEGEGQEERENEKERKTEIGGGQRVRKRGYEEGGREGKTYTLP